MVELEKDFETIHKMNYNQGEWLMLFYIMKNKVNHLFRTIPCYHINILADFMDKQMQKHLGLLVGQDIDDVSFARACLPIGEGGIGISSFKYCRKAAFIASSMTCSNYLFKLNIIDEQHQWYKIHVKLGALDYQRVIEPQITIINFDVKAWYKPFQDRNVNDFCLQELFMEPITKTMVEKYVKLLTDTRSFDLLRRFNLARSPHSGKFLLAIPRSFSSKMSNKQFRIALRMRLDVNLIDIDLILTCNCHRKIQLDKFGDHLFACNKGNDWQVRHNIMVKELSRLSSDAGIHHKLESLHDIYTQDGHNKKPDITYCYSDLHNGAKVAWDITFTHPSANESNNYGPEILGVQAKKREETKNSKYLADARANGMLFYPLVFETYGYWTKTVDDLIKNLCQLAAIRSGIPFSTLKHHWICRLSAVIQKCNADLVESKLEEIMKRKFQIARKRDVYTRYMDFD